MEIGLDVVIDILAVLGDDVASLAAQPREAQQRP
jgi:hypothetical protein